ncbi:MAG: aspartate--tRNA(Asn) ligase [Candidatus Nealsonbacteria bacterium]|nr:aspartate--tRNA(Asn) ligase [Candidatus Nealsonbacteria bacterium]
MERILNIETIKHTGEKVRVCGWVNTRRDHGKLVFIDLRDRTGLLQIVCQSALVKDIKEEYVLQIKGIIKERPENMVNKEIETGKVELQAENVEILAKSSPIPFDFMAEDLNLKLPTLLDYRPLTIRNPKIKSIFKIGEHITNSFRKTMKDLDFTGFESPNIVPAVAEGGADVFHVDYYNYNAYLAQSPQLYKQIMLGAFERVFTITHVYRAEPSITTRHLAEYTSLDAEISFIDSWENLMDICEKIIKNMFSDLEENCQKELSIHKVKVPLSGKKIPRIKMREVQQIILERTGRDNRKEPDLQPEDEQEICQWAKEKHGSELVFVTHYPTKKRPFYTHADPKDPDYTLSFDLLCRGLEIVTGGQRINDYDKLTANIKKWGNETKNFSFYLQTFKYGLPPEGGFALGLERIVKQVLNLKNVREAVPFPRDMERIDQRLSTLQKKKTKKSKR